MRSDRAIVAEHDHGSVERERSFLVELVAIARAEHGHGLWYEQWNQVSERFGQRIVHQAECHAHL